MNFVLLDLIPLLWSVVFCASAYLMLGGKSDGANLFAIPSGLALAAALASVSPKIQVFIFVVSSAFFIITEKIKKIKQ